MIENAVANCLMFLVAEINDILCVCEVFILLVV